MTKKEMIYVGMSTAIVGFVLFAYGDFLYRRWFRMTYKQIEASRELRLWIGQVFIPVGLCVATVMSVPGAKEAASEKVEKIKKKFRKTK